MRNVVIVVTALIVLTFVSLPWTFSAVHRGHLYDRQRYGYGSLRALRRDARGARGFFCWGTFLALIGYAAAARAVCVVAPGTAPWMSWVADLLVLSTVVSLICHVTTILTGKPAALVRVPRRATRTVHSARRSAATGVSRAGQ